MTIEELEKCSEECYEQEEFHKAIVYLKEILLIDNKNSQAYESMGICYLEIKEIDKAEGCFTKAIEMNAANAEAWYLRGVIRMDQGFDEMALKDLEEAIKLDESNVDYMTSRVELAIQMKDVNSNRKYCTELLKQNKENPFALENLGYTHAKAGNHEESLQYFSQALEINPLSSNAFNSIGYSLSKMEEYEEAIKYYTAAIELNAEYAEAYDNRGLCKCYLGDLEGARIDIDMAIDLAPSDSYPYKNRAILNEKLNRIDLAIKDLESAIMLGYPQFYDSIASDMLMRLKKDNSK